MQTGYGSSRAFSSIATASLAMGGGIWVMHFVGMLALQMAVPVL